MRRDDDARTRGSSGRWSAGHTGRRSARGDNTGAVAPAHAADEAPLKGPVSTPSCQRWFPWLE